MPSSVFTKTKVPLTIGLHLRANLNIDLSSDSFKDGIAIIIQNHESGNKYIGVIENPEDMGAIYKDGCGLVIKIVQNNGARISIDYGDKNESKSLSFNSNA